MEIDASQYLRSEIDRLHADAASSREEIRRLERYALVTTAGVWSWAASHTETPTVWMLGWAPALISALFGLRALGHHQQARADRKAILALERLALGQNTLPLTEARRQRHQLLAWTGYGFWGILRVATLVAPMLIKP